MKFKFIKRINQHLQSFLLFILIFIFSYHRSHSQSSKNKFVQNINFILPDSLNGIEIINPSMNSVQFQFVLNNRFPLSTKTIIKEVKERAKKKKISKIKAAWQYVIKHTYKDNPLTSESWQHEPTLFLNSIGGGLCDDLSTVLVSIWQELGYEARVILLNGHVVAEVKDKHGWHMYDPDMAVYYTDSKGRVLSVEELENQPEYVIEPNLEIKKGSYLNPLMNYKNKITQRVGSFYKTQEDNADITDWSLNYSAIQQDIQLPSKSKFKLFQDLEQNKNLAFVSLNKNTKGKLSVPFVPLMAEGDFQFIRGKDTIEIKNEPFYFSTDTFYSSIEILNVNAKSYIYYLINDKIPLLEEKNTLTIESSDSIIVNTLYKDITPIHYENGAFQLNKYNELHRSFLSVVQPISDDEDLISYLRKEFNHFINYNDFFSVEDKSICIERLDSFFQTNEFQSLDFEFFKNYFPFSTYYFFIMIAHDQEGEIFEYLTESLSKKLE